MPKKPKSNLSSINVKRNKLLRIRDIPIEKSFIFRSIHKILSTLRPISAKTTFAVRASHYKRITSSNIYRILRYPSAKSTHSKCDWLTLKSKHVKYGKIFENSISNYLQNKHINFYAQQWLTTHKYYSWLGSTPDAIIKVIDCLECRKMLMGISNLVYAYQSGVGTGSNDKVLDGIFINFMKNVCFKERIVVEFKVIGRYQWCRTFNIDRSLKLDCEIYHQLQYEMYLLNCRRAYLICKTKGLKTLDIKAVEFDFGFIKKTIVNLQSFYNLKRLPIIVYKKHRNFMEAKDKDNERKISDIKIEKTALKPIRKRSNKKIKVASKEDEMIIYEFVQQQFKHLLIGDQVLLNDDCLKEHKNICHDFFNQDF